MKERTPHARHRRLGHRIAAFVTATAAAASCGAVLGQATPAVAGGDPTRDCLPGARANIPSNHDYPVSAAHLAGGYYAQAGLFWPPATAAVCKTAPDLRQPLIRIGQGGCDASALPFLIPDASPAVYTDITPPTWGTFLPAGWYYLGEPTTPDWTTVCWYVLKPKVTA
ncbi:hypothetical protein [Pseudofrankia sp. BMG5.37]|uniref:hypothetical protein n=1 Tax=Pseudofrankia sp. BMG5.37 TaxID=3050035 RepID=UPI002893AC3D|nr:hypothetical protein [Pseudofrankia sp. BMG5.37]MDT3442335.1 hypothetical protein [Pseudofrankia sp. BMG5.37]